MLKLDQLTDGILNRFRIQIPAGTTLFRQNDKGTTLYVLLEGSVKLTHRIAQTDRTLLSLGPGDIVGEKALCVTGPYRRAFTATAESNAVVLELDAQRLKMIAAKIPDFSAKLLTAVVERLDRVTALIAVLQTPVPLERLSQYLVYLCNHSPKRSGSEVEISLSEETALALLGIDRQTLAAHLNELVAEKFLTPKDKGFLVSDTAALSQRLFFTPEKLAA